MMTDLQPISLCDEQTFVKAQIEDRYIHYAACLVKKDMTSILALLTPDFTWRLLDGQVLTREQTESALQEYFRETTVLNMHIQIAEMWIEGESVGVIAEEHFVSLPEVSLPAAEGEGQPCLTTEVVKETWVFMPQGLQLRASEVVSSVSIPQA